MAWREIHLQEPWWSYVANGRKRFHLQPVREGQSHAGDTIKIIRSGKAISTAPSQIVATVISAAVFDDLASALRAQPLDCVFPGMDNLDLAAAVCGEPAEGDGRIELLELRLEGNSFPGRGIESSSVDLPGRVYMWSAFGTSTPATLDAGQAVDAVAVGGDHVLMLAAGRVLAFGSNSHGQLAQSTKSVAAPVSIEGLPCAAVAIAAGKLHSAAVAADGEVYCWGRASQGQCGPSSEPVLWQPTKVPFPVLPGGSRVTAIACGAEHTVALTNIGLCFSWGRGAQLGLGATDSCTIPTFVDLGGLRAVSLACGEFHSMVVVRPADAHGPASNSIMAWGKNDRGQLGLGNFETQRLPRPVEALDEHHIIQIAAGSMHSLALSCTGVAYAWGRGSDCQLGHSAGEDCSVPREVHYFKGSAISVVGVAAGEQHSLFLCGPGPDFTHRMYFAGPRSSFALSFNLESFDEQDALPTLVQGCTTMGFVRHIAAGGKRCFSVCDGFNEKAGLLRSLACSEVGYCAVLSALRDSVRSATESASPAPGRLPVVCDPALDVLMVLLDDVAELSCNTAATLLDVIPHWQTCDLGASLASLSPFGAYERYAVALVNAISVGAFRNASLQASLSEMLRQHGRHLELDSTGDDMMRGLFALPQKRMNFMYQRLSDLAHIAETYLQPSAHRLREQAAVWGRLAQETIEACMRAEDTAVFWAEHAAIRKLLCQPGRRVLRHSKTLPLSSNKSMIHSANWFILFNDCFVHSTMFGTKIYPLGTTWVVDVPDTDALKNAFKLVFPEESLTLYSPNKHDWMLTINRAISGLLVMHSSGIPNIRADPDVLTSSQDANPSTSRRAFHAFRHHPYYREAEYNGEWVLGRCEGQGRMVCADGRVLDGSFANGVCHGRATMSATINNGPIRVASGLWFEGRLHGQAKVEFHLGSKYDGDWQCGIRSGHGELINEAGDLYVGGWENDLQHGYGVYEDAQRQQKYLGMWVEGARQGAGIVVTEDGLYYEGFFAHNRLIGHGLMLFDDGSSFDGEFTGDMILQGRGVFAMPCGLQIEGTYSGTWGDRSGVKVSGTIRTTTRSLAVAGQEPSLLDLYHEDDADSRGVYACRTDAQRPRRVAPDSKWDSIFERCRFQLGMTSRRGTAVLSKYLQPALAAGRETRVFLTDSFLAPAHPLCLMLDTAVRVFQASFKGVGANRRLLSCAIDEVRSLLDRSERVVVEMLPEAGIDRMAATDVIEPLFFSRIYSVLFTLYRVNCQDRDRAYWRNASSLRGLSHARLMHRLAVTRKFWLMDTTDEAEERRVLHRSQLTPSLPPVSPPPIRFTASPIAAPARPADDADDSHCTPLPAEMRAELAAAFKSAHDQGSPVGSPRVGPAHRVSVSPPPPTETKPEKPEKARKPTVAPGYESAVTAFQSLPSVFSPVEKLQVLHDTFRKINDDVLEFWSGQERLLSMDDVLPLILYVVVRARIRHLGAEVRFLNDFLHMDSLSGESRVLLTTLRAAYYQLQFEAPEKGGSDA
eukprot:m.97717 g.97717  ORF g.97717 m.97717 type:complete len:1510 (-) comp8676_c0_seq2:738-5267(-)